ncbi:hypothetical protein KY328_03970 [Candidatus Woesearchaeota archaeon]|nr:hypothetical protein [Candidatus Woesearchaeota archaeon]MBW3022054.1 hypothetical protein [Candidatus Woesearchaeota archaeon]
MKLAMIFSIIVLIIGAYMLVTNLSFGAPMLSGLAFILLGLGHILKK